MQVYIRIANLPQVINDFNKYEARVIKQIMQIVKVTSEGGVRKLKAEHFGRTSSTSVKSRSGKLMKSIFAKKTEYTGGIIKGGISIGGKVPYSKVHINYPRGRETIISPKKAKFLAIPTQFARTGSGVPRGRPSDPIWGRTFVAQGMIWGFQRGTSREYATPRPLFILKQSVKVQSRIDPRVDLAQYMKPYLISEISKALGGASVSVRIRVK